MRPAVLGESFADVLQCSVTHPGSDCVGVRLPAVGTGDEDDSPAGATPNHRVEHLAGATDLGDDFDLQSGAPLLVAHLSERRGRRAPGVVDEHLDAAEARLDVAHHVGDSISVGHIGDHAVNTGAGLFHEACDRGGKAPGMTGGHDYRSPFERELFGNDDS